MAALLEVRHLSIDFDGEGGALHAVRDVSFSLAAGETLALVGESGCGKSVLCKSIPGLLHRRGRIAGGEILYDGKDLATRDERALCGLRGSEIAMIPQDPSTAFNPSISVGEQIAEAVRAHEKISRAAAKARALALMERVELDRPTERYAQPPRQFSGGMLQRAALAAAIAQSPKILLADEPTTALDVTVQARMLTLLLSLQRETGVAILFVTHDLGLVAKIAGRVAVMYAGKIVEIGTVRELFYDPRHPYTWGLLESLPSAQTDGGLLRGIPGAPPVRSGVPLGDAFAPRNRYALQIDYEREPPFFQISGTHFAATWLLHPAAPRVKPPVRVAEGRVIVNE